MSVHFLIGRKILKFESLESTQDVAIELARRGIEEGTVVVAEEQKKGRGRLGREWFSLRSKALTFSFILYPQIPVEYSFYLSIFPAIACAVAIEKRGIGCSLKWPNDILIDEKKAGGILVESENEEGKIKWAVVGIGINVNMKLEDFPDKLKEIATSLSIKSGKNFDKDAILRDILSGLNENYKLINSVDGREKLRIEWGKRDFLKGKTVRIRLEDKLFEGKAEGVDEKGFLKLRMGEDVVLIPAGEVEIVK